MVDLGLSRAASAVLTGVEEERKMARERARTTGRVADWWEDGAERERLIRRWRKRKMRGLLASKPLRLVLGTLRQWWKRRRSVRSLTH